MSDLRTSSKDLVTNLKCLHVSSQNNRAIQLSKVPDSRRVLAENKF